MPQKSIIVAIDENNAIGKGNELLCYLPNDLRHFKALTSGHTVIMGRKTFESLPKGALPNRYNIVMTHNLDLQFEGCDTYGSLDEVMVSPDTDIFFIGGASIYKESIKLVDKLYVTHIHHSFEGSDTFFPEIDMSVWKETERADFVADDKHPYAYSFVTYTRI